MRLIHRCIFFGVLSGMLLVVACDRGSKSQPAQKPEIEKNTATAENKAEESAVMESVQHESMVLRDDSVSAPVVPQTDTSASIDSVNAGFLDSTQDTTAKAPAEYIAVQKDESEGLLSSSARRTRSSSSVAEEPTSAEETLPSSETVVVDTCANVPDGYVCDRRDNHLYGTVRIGAQTWLAQNLNYATEGSWCYGNKQVNCDNFGRLYNWTSAMAIDASYLTKSASAQIKQKHRGVCLEGWHVPTMREVNALETFIDNFNSRHNLREEQTGTSLKSRIGWAKCDSEDEDCVVGTNRFGFAALPSGRRDADGSFNEFNEGFAMWVANEADDKKRAPYWELYYATDKFWGSYFNLKTTAYSVRCLKD